MINPQTGLPIFGDETWYAYPSNDLNHYNGIFTNDNTKVQWMSGVNYNSIENLNNGMYDQQFIYPKIFSFDTETGEFSFYDLDIQDTDPGDDHLAVSYDTNDDGIFDEVDSIPVCYPSWYYDGYCQYRLESNCKMDSNRNWVVGAWHDCEKLYHAKLHFAFMDDEEYGSSSQLTGGDLYYAAINLKFKSAWLPENQLESDIVPTEKIHLKNSPNPFNPVTNIQFSIPKESMVALSIYNIKGQKVKQLLSEKLQAGQHSVVWNGTDSNSKSVASGLYFYKLNLNGKTQVVKKCIFLK